MNAGQEAKRPSHRGTDSASRPTNAWPPGRPWCPAADQAEWTRAPIYRPRLSGCQRPHAFAVEAQVGVGIIVGHHLAQLRAEETQLGDADQAINIEPRIGPADRFQRPALPFSRDDGAPVNLQEHAAHRTAQRHTRNAHRGSRAACAPCTRDSRRAIRRPLRRSARPCNPAACTSWASSSRAAQEVSMTGLSAAAISRG